MISIYAPDTTTWTDNGIKVLQPRRAFIRKEDNGDYYLTIEDIAANFDLYQQDRIIAVDTTPWGRQPFRVASPQMQDGKVTVKAYHITQTDSKLLVVADTFIVNKNANAALAQLNAATDETSPFTTIGDTTTTQNLRVVRDSLWVAVQNIAARWGGHITLDGWEIGIRDTIGEDRGVSIAYGKNITQYGVTEDWNTVTTKILPVGANGILLDSRYLEQEPEDYPIPYTRTVSFDQGDIKQEDYEDEAAYQAALRADLTVQASAYLADNHLPKVNYTFGARIEGVTDLGDIIRVSHPRINTELVTAVLAIEYDPLTDKITKVEFGNFNPKLSNLVSSQQAAMKNIVSIASTNVTSALTTALQQATAEINAVLGNSYVIYEGNQILVVDALPKEDATNVMRINAGGIGFSTTGITGTFNSAWTIDGTLDMQAINVINLTADMLRGGTLQIGNYNGATGIIEIYDASGNPLGSWTESGLNLTTAQGDTLDINATDGLKYTATIGGVPTTVFQVLGAETRVKNMVASDQITMSPIKIVPIPTGNQAGWAFVKII